MAILKMKRLRLMVIRSEKEQLLKELAGYGCVEFSEIGDEMQASQLGDLVKRESSMTMALKSRHAVLDNAIAILDKYAPGKKALLSAVPEFESEIFLDDAGIADAEKHAETIINADDRVKRISAEESRLRAVSQSLEPWLPLDMPLEMDSTESCSIIMGTVSVKTSIAEMESAMAEVSEEAELFLISADKRQQYVLLVCRREELASFQECLRGFGFTAVAFGGTEGTARDGIAAIAGEIKALGEQKAEHSAIVVAEAEHRNELMLASDRLNTAVAMAEAEGKLYGMQSVVVMEGWMPENCEDRLEKLFEKYDCAWDTREPEEEEYPEVPVKLKNNVVTNSLNMVTEMYSLPAYGTVDPNPWMTPFFILFYGLMMADMGYGLIMIAAALVAMAKIKPRGGTLAFCELLLYGGISTFIIGALTGGFFGDAPYQLVHMFNPDSTWEGLPYLFSPITDSETVLYGAMVLGIIHLVTGMIISFIHKTKSGDLAGAIWEEGSMWVVLIGLALFVLKIGNIAGVPVVLIAGVAMLLFGAGRDAKGFGKVTAAVGCIYNTLTGWFGDILSYSRIMALMLAGGVVAQVFNSIAVMPAAAMGVKWYSILIFLLIFLVGHALNFALNILGCFVHDLRLQCLEFFGKFYTDGGRPFSPLEVKAKYARPKQN